jgi:hypothetical protein
MSHGKHRRRGPKPYSFRSSEKRQRRQAWRDTERVAHKRVAASPQCGTKRAYPTRAIANGKVGRLRNRFGEACLLHAYHCPYCGAYHVGNPAWASPTQEDDRKGELQ